MTAHYSLMGEQKPVRLAEILREVPSGYPVVEVGVYRGGSALPLYQVTEERGEILHLFDTFEGIPFKDEIDRDQQGDFDAREVGGANAIQALMPRSVLHIGIFPKTMPKFGLEMVSFVHSDCDQYRSVRAVIDTFWPRLVPGGVMAFDDMDTPGGEKAILETFPNQFADGFHSMPPVHQHNMWWIVRKKG